MATKTKKATNVSTSTPETSANGNGRAKKEGLRKPQKRVLLFLAGRKEPSSRSEIAEKASCDLAFLTEYLGSNDPAKREHNDTKPGGFPSLITLGLVKAQVSEETKGSLYMLTAKGRKEAEKIKKE